MFATLKKPAWWITTGIVVVSLLCPTALWARGGGRGGGGGGGGRSFSGGGGGSVRSFSGGGGASGSVRAFSGGSGRSLSSGVTGNVRTNTGIVGRSFNSGTNLGANVGANVNRGSANLGLNSNLNSNLSGSRTSNFRGPTASNSLSARAFSNNAAGRTFGTNAAARANFSARNFGAYNAGVNAGLAAGRFGPYSGIGPYGLGYGGLGYGLGYGGLGYGFGYPFFGMYGLGGLGYGLGGMGYGGYGGGYGGYGGGFANNAPANAPANVAANPGAPTDEQVQLANDFEARGEADFQAGNYQAAVQDFQHALVDTPHNGPVMLLLAQALFATGQFQPAAGAVQLGMQMLPQDQWGNVVKHYSDLYPPNDDYINQVKALENAQAANPSDPALHFLLGYEYGYLDYPQQAVKQLDAALQARPQDRGAAMMRNQFAAQANIPQIPLPAAPEPPKQGAPSARQQTNSAPVGQPVGVIVRR